MKDQLDKLLYYIISYIITFIRGTVTIYLTQRSVFSWNRKIFCYKSHAFAKSPILSSLGVRPNAHPNNQVGNMLGNFILNDLFCLFYSLT